MSDQYSRHLSSHISWLLSAHSGHIVTQFWASLSYCVFWRWRAASLDSHCPPNPRHCSSPFGKSETVNFFMACWVLGYSSWISMAHISRNSRVCQFVSIRNSSYLSGYEQRCWTCHHQNSNRYIHRKIPRFRSQHSSLPLPECCHVGLEKRVVGVGFQSFFEAFRDSVLPEFVESGEGFVGLLGIKSTFGF